MIFLTEMRLTQGIEKDPFRYRKKIVELECKFIFYLTVVSFSIFIIILQYEIYVSSVAQSVGNIASLGAVVAGVSSAVETVCPW